VNRKANARHTMRSFWDKKARENPMYYISSYRPYDQQDPQEFWKWGEKLAEQFLGESEIPFTGEERVLEIGCGMGRMTSLFARRFGHVTGVDVSEEMIALARENLRGVGNVSLDVGNGSDLSAYGDASFDFVFSYIVLQHIPDANITQYYIQEMGRVLHPGGFAYFQCNNMKWTLRERMRLGRLKGLFSKSRGEVDADGPKDLDNPAWQGSRLTVRQIIEAAAAGGLDVIRLTGEGTQYLWVKACKPQ